MECFGREDFSVAVVASDLGVDSRSLLSPAERRQEDEEEEGVSIGNVRRQGEDFSDLEDLQVICVQGRDKHGNRILRIVGRFFPASVISEERLKIYIALKLDALDVGEPLCIVYMHSAVKSVDNNPGMFALRRIYEGLSSGYKERIASVYFLHPGLLSWLALATLGRLFLSGGLYSKVKYVSRVEYLWEDMKKGEVTVPDFVLCHDEVLEHRPLTDYGIEPDVLHLPDIPTAAAAGYPLGRRSDDTWPPRAYM